MRIESGNNYTYKGKEIPLKWKGEEPLGSVFTAKDYRKFHDRIWYPASGAEVWYAAMPDPKSTETLMSHAEDVAREYREHGHYEFKKPPFVAGLREWHVITLEELSPEEPLWIEPAEGAEVNETDLTYAKCIGKPCPLQVLSSVEGKPMEKLSDFRGKVVVLDFWASWCPPCINAVTHLQDICRKRPEWKGKVELIAVTVDEELPKGVAVIKDKNWTDTLHRAIDFKALNAIGIDGVPMIMILAPDGTVAVLGTAHEVNIEHEVAALLAK